MGVADKSKLTHEASSELIRQVVAAHQHVHHMQAEYEQACRDRTAAVRAAYVAGVKAVDMARAMSLSRTQMYQLLDLDARRKNGKNTGETRDEEVHPH